MPLCGGTGEARAPTADEVALLTSLRSRVEDRLGKAVDLFEPVLVATQVVAGTNYFAKVRVASDAFVHVRAFKPLPHVNEATQVHGLQTGKTAEEDLAYFEAN